MEKNSERRWRSKVTEGLRVKMPKKIADIYKVKKDDIVEWIYDGRENIRIEIKEMVLREKKAKVGEVEDRDVEGAVMRTDDKRAKDEKAEDEKVKSRDIGDAVMRTEEKKGTSGG